MDNRGMTIEELLRVAKEDVARNSLTSAEKMLEQAILMNNQVPEAFHLLGNVYTKRGKFKKAILAFQRALALDPFHTEAAIALSSLYNDVGKYKEGELVFLKAKRRLERTAPGFDPRINSDLAKRHHELGLLYMRYERFQEAYTELIKAQNLEPDNTAVSVHIAKALAKMDDKEGAIEFLHKKLASNPKNAEMRVQLGVLYHSQTKLKDAHREWQEALSLDPDNKSAQMYLSMFD